jgi:hypothetical protein
MRAVLLALVMLTGCKGLGALGHLGSGLSHVGRAVAISSRVIAPVARTAFNVAVNSTIAASQMGEVEVVTQGEIVEHVPVEDGPLIDNGDVCGYCPDTLACGECGDTKNVACIVAPAGAYARCESQR